MVYQNMRHRTLAIMSVFVMITFSHLWAQDFIANEDCMECHDGKSVDSAFAHQPSLDVHCISCHQASDETYEEHMEEPEDAYPGIPVGESAFQVCGKCHQSEAVTYSNHAEEGLNCSECHQLHSDKKLNPKFLITTVEKDLCSRCHQDVILEMSKPFSHPIGEGGMSCSSCHDVHNPSAEASLREEVPGQLVCYTCHSDKKGPFVFEHVTDFVGDCRSCHETHGSSNPAHLTRIRVSQLCLECHSMTSMNTLGSQPPSRHDMYSPRYQNCTVCHVTVHGSNRSPMLLK